MEYEKLIEQETETRRNAARELDLIDANMWLGKGKEFPLAPSVGPGDVKEIYEKYFLAGGLLSHWNALSLSAQDANEALLEAENKLPPNTWTVWTGLPLLPREQDPLPGFGAPREKMGGVRIFPKSHRYECRPWIIGDLCSWCVEYGVPLFIWHVEADWPGLYDLAGGFPKLKLIVETQWQKILYHNRTLYNLMRHRPNVFLEISNFSGQDFLSNCVQTFGADRFIFGSFLPMNDPFVPLGMILDAEISDVDKRKIAGGNMKRLLDEVAR